MAYCLCALCLTCFCRMTRSQSSTSQGFISSGIFTFTSMRLANISSWTNAETIKFLVILGFNCGYLTLDHFENLKILQYVWLIIMTLWMKHLILLKIKWDHIQIQAFYEFIMS